MQLHAAENMDARLVADAHAQPPVSRRDELLIMATERFCGTENHDRLSVDQYKEAFRALSGTASSETLELLSKILSQTPYTPREVCLYLALEDMAIARHVLRHAMQLGQLDMVQIIGKCGIPYAREIATRPDLGPSLVKHLHLLDDTIIDENIAANPALARQKIDAPSTAPAPNQADLSGQRLRITKTRRNRRTARPEVSYTVTRTRMNKPEPEELKTSEADAARPSVRTTEKTAAETAAVYDQLIS